MEIRYNINQASKYRITCVFILLIVYLNANSNNFNTSVEKQQIEQANNLEIDQSARKQQAGVRNYRDEDDDHDKGERRNNGIKLQDQQKQNKQRQKQKQEDNQTEGKENVEERIEKNQVSDEEIKIQDTVNRQMSSSEEKMAQKIVENPQQQIQAIKQQQQKKEKVKKVQPQKKQEQNQNSSQRNSKKQIKKNDVSVNRQNSAQSLIEIIQPYFSIFSSCYHSLIAPIAPLLPESISYLTQSACISIIDYFSRKLLPLIRSYHILYKLLTEPQKQKPKKVYYQNNFANLYGGAKIIMKSSSKIKSLNSILEDGPDKYMYTDEQLPLKIIIGLNQEIAIDSIIIQSYQMYSCITREFIVEGKFAMEDKKWVYLGGFEAKNVFGDQEFKTERKIVRYVKITFLSAYGKWSYFTLTQVKIRGKSLFADALTQQPQNPKSQSTPSTPTHQQSHKQQQQQRPHRNTCQNKFNPPSTQPHENNLIKSLITKLDRLQTYNTIQNKEMSQLQQKLINVTQKLNEKVEENKMYQNILKQYKKEIDKNYYVIWISLAISGVTAVFLVCLGLVRRRELGEFRKKYGKEGKEGAGGFEVKKSNSIK